LKGNGEVFFVSFLLEVNIAKVDYDILRLKVNRAEFKLACSNGEVYGEVVRGILPYVYAELGKEGRYHPGANDDPNTNYRIFFNCIAYFTDTKENLKNRDVKKSVDGVKIIIYT
jgi:hypothetical protein